MKTFVPESNQPPNQQPGADQKPLPPIAPPYCDQDDYPHPATPATGDATAPVVPRFAPLDHWGTRIKPCTSE